MFVVKSFRGPTHWWSQGSRSWEGPVPMVAALMLWYAVIIHILWSPSWIESTKSVYSTIRKNFNL